jgi:hypothetical protein
VEKREVFGMAIAVADEEVKDLPVDEALGVPQWTVGIGANEVGGID